MGEGLSRVIAGTVIGVVTLFFLRCQEVFLSFFFVFILGLFMAMEWANIVKNVPDPRKWHLLGILYIACSLLPMLWLKFYVDSGDKLLLWLFILAWSTDTFAYVVGYVMKLGRHRIHSVSPLKSYEGLLGGMLASLVFCTIFSFIYLPTQRRLLLLCTPIFCCLEQAGDFTESYVKRKFGVKDSGNMIPGHGGFLDRFDGFLYINILMLCLL
jgi:phosphatidate cytidylyltransferase